MKFVKYFSLLVILLSQVSALCTQSQIDINSASLSKLDELTGIGQKYAQAIVDKRPFSSVDNLIDVKGIGPATLEKIKSQGLACVEGEEKIAEKAKTDVAEEETTEDSSEDTERAPTSSETSTSPIQSESIINLGVDQVKEETVYESKNEKVKKNLLVAFCVFLIGLIFLLIKK